MWLCELEYLEQEYVKYKAERIQSQSGGEVKKVVVKTGAAKKVVKKTAAVDLEVEETMELPVKVKSKKIVK